MVKSATAQLGNKWNETYREMGSLKIASLFNLFWPWFYLYDVKTSGKVILFN